MKLPRRMWKRISDKFSDWEVALAFMAGVLFPILAVGLILLLSTPSSSEQTRYVPSRYCACPDREEQREQARRFVTEQEAETLRHEAERRVRERRAEQRNLKVVRTPAAERVRAALKAWKREQAEREAAVRAALESPEIIDETSEPAAELDQ